MSMPPGLPPDPNQPPTTPMTPPPAPQYPAYPAAQPADAPQGGYSAPPQFPVAPPYQAAPAGYADPLVLAPGSSFSAWFAKFQEVAKRSWKSSLIIMLLGVAAPRALVALIGGLAGYGGGYSYSVLTHIGTFFLGLLVTLVLSIAAAFVASAAWAAGTWALIQEAQTGQSANLGAAFQYGFRRAMAIFPWAVVAGFAVTLGTICLFLPGLYLAFAFSMFGFAAIFERGKNPLGRSFNLTHKSSQIGPTIGKVAIVFGIYLIYSLIIGAIFGAIAVAVAFGSIRSGVTTDLGFVGNFIEAIGTLLTGPVLAVVLVGLFVTYAELRAQEAPLNTATLAQELG